MMGVMILPEAVCTLRETDDIEVVLEVEEVREVPYEVPPRSVFPVGALWATEDPEADPAEVLGFGTWEKVSPGAVTWKQLADTTWNMTGTVEGIYVWKRIE